jgi:hypothetical protein
MPLMDCSVPFFFEGKGSNGLVDSERGSHLGWVVMGWA